MKDQLNDQLIKQIVDRTPPNLSKIEFLSRILSIGKRTAQRRLQGEVPFSFGEAYIISKRLNFSLDDLNSSNTNFQLSFDDIDLQSIESSLKLMEGYLDIYEKIKDNNDVHVSLACNIIPYFITINYDYVHKFCIYRWYYRLENNSSIRTYSELEIPPLHKKKQMVARARLGQIPNTTMILDPHVFSSLIEDIKYFRDLGLLNREDCINIKSDLLEILHNLEYAASIGKNKFGKDLEIYLSDIDFDASYGYIESTNFQIAEMRIFSLNALSTENANFCKLQKEWIESMKRYSTLISKSGVIQRREFVEYQKKFIEQI